MQNRYSDNTFWVRAQRGELRQLFAFREHRSGRTVCDDEWLRWARDDAGRWYSFSTFGDAVIDSLSGDWFAIVANAKR